MLKNYLKIAFRNLVKNSLFSAINICGMAISITTFIIIALFVSDELSYDKHVRDVGLKYRIYNDLYTDDGSMRKMAMVPPMIAPTLAAEYPEVDYYTRFLNFNQKVLFKSGDRKFSEDKGGYADPTVFDMFSLTLLEGDASSALADPNTLAISQSLAQKYFGDKPALGESLEIFKTNFVVKAVFKDFSPHSHLQLNYFLSLTGYASQNPDRMKRWGWSQFHTYIKLKEGADAAELEAKLPGFAERHAWSETKQNGNHYIPHVMPMDQIHLKAFDQQVDIAVRGNAQTVYILSGTALFILVIAILNFVNLSTARAVNRVKEVGVRKVMGAIRWQLIYQFISESTIISFLALLIAAVAAQLILPLINSFTEKTIPIDLLTNPIVILGLFASALLIGIVAGAYPAFYISSHEPSKILSNKPSGRGGKGGVRQGLVVLQFILSFFLISAALIVSEQHTYLRTKDMGFNKDNLVVIGLRGDMRKDLEAAKTAFLNNPGVAGGTMGYGLPGQAFAGDGIRDKVTNKDWSLSMLTVDADYVKTLGLTLLAGRDFSKEFPTDERNSFIVSESAVRMMGFGTPEEALDHPLAWPRWDYPDSLKEGRVIGVVKDIHLNSLRENVTPVVIHIFPFAYNTFTLRLTGNDIPGTIAQLESTWKKFNADWPFEYKFLDENFDKMYKSEEKLATLFTFFTGFTIFVACLGLFGLVVYSTTQRYKEISIRKLLGASERGLVIQLGKNFLVLIVVAFVIATPMSVYAASGWLESFAYRIDLTPWLFLKAAGSIVVIAMLTVGIQSLKAARANPVDSLKEQ